MIDAVTGYHMWSEEFDREMKAFFQLLDDITHKVVVELQIELTHGEQVRNWNGTTNFESWGYTAKGHSLFETYTKANNERARELFEQALEIDPQNAFALCMLSWTYVIEARYGFRKSPSESLGRAAQIAQKAQAINDTLPEVHALRERSRLDDDVEKTLTREILSNIREKESKNVLERSDGILGFSSPNFCLNRGRFTYQ